MRKMRGKTCEKPTHSSGKQIYKCWKISRGKIGRICWPKKTNDRRQQQQLEKRRSGGKRIEKQKGQHSHWVFHGIPNASKGERGVAWRGRGPVFILMQIFVYFWIALALFLLSSLPLSFFPFFGGFLVMKNVGFVFCSHMSCWYFFSI